MNIFSFFRKSEPSAPFTGDDDARMKLYKKLRFQSFCGSLSLLPIGTHLCDPVSQNHDFAKYKFLFFCVNPYIFNDHAYAPPMGVV